jgi:hypothetical protein
LSRRQIMSPKLKEKEVAYANSDVAFDLLSAEEL